MQITEAFLLTVIGLFGTGCAVLLRYFLKSRCKTVKCFCITCERDVVSEEKIDDVSV
jgi:hypothetical protein